MNKLISMVAYITKQHDTWWDCKQESFYECVNYANFLNTPLNLSMFVPCIKVGDKWEILEEPMNFNDMQEFGSVRQQMQNDKDWEQYAKAKENVIFEGFDLVKTNRDLEILTINYDNETIQDLIKYSPTLTENGMIKSGLK